VGSVSLPCFVRRGATAVRDPVRLDPAELAASLTADGGPHRLHPRRDRIRGRGRVTDAKRGDVAAGDVETGGSGGSTRSCMEALGKNGGWTTRVGRPLRPRSESRAARGPRLHPF
jgi:hypothetical protein